MQVKAHGKGCAGPPVQPLLAAQILAISGKKKLSRIGQSEALAVAVMCCRDPLLAFVLGAFTSNRRRIAAEGAIISDFDRVGVAHHEHRVRRTRPRHARPARFWSAIGAAIDDDALALMTHFKRQRAGVGGAVETTWWRSPGIDDREASAGLQTVEAALGCLRRCAPLVSERVRTKSIRTPSYSSESLNSARRRSPCRKKRSIGAIRSIACCSPPGVSICAARKTARVSIRSCKT